MRPISTPLDISSRKKPSASGMGERLDRPALDVHDLHARLERRLAAVLVRDRRRQLDLVLPRVEGLDDGRVLLDDVAPAYLTGAGHLGVVGLKILGEQEAAAHLDRVRQRLVALADLLADQLAHLGLLREVHVARVRDASPLGPVTASAEVDRENSGDEG